MADITLTGPTYTGVFTERIMTAGATIVAGQTIYEDTLNGGVAKLGHAVTSSLTAKVVGIAMAGGLTGSRIPVCTEGEIQVSGTPLAPGACYVQSGATGGALADHADLITASTWRGTFIGIATANNKLKVKPIISDTVNP